MSAHIVFVRFFVGYRSPFPYERFAGSNDEDINSVAEAIRHEWWSDSVNRTRFESWRIETERRRIESEVLLRGRFAPGVPVPALPDNVQCFSILLTPAPGERARIPSFLEMATAAGWRQLWSDEFLPYCISPRYPLAQFNTKELADDAAESLRARVSELFEGAATTHNRDDLAVLFWSANPQFFVVEEGELPRPALATTREQIQRLRGPISGTPTLEERYVREYWPLIVPTIDQIKALPSVDDDLSAAVEEAEEKPKLDLSAAVEEAKEKPKLDGLFGTDGFRFRGAELRFGRAALPRKLVSALWDEKTHSTRDALPAEDVLAQAYGQGHQTSDSTFRQLCTDLRSRFQAANVALGVEYRQGNVQLIPLPG